MLGQLQIPLNSKQYFTLTGGPSHEARDYPEMEFVKMAKEINLPCSINIPTRDFSVPDPVDLSRGLREAVDFILAGKPVYVGCMAGRGRTGLFLAVLARAFGVENPVEYVRANYYPHAVETADQYKFVMEFKIQDVILDRIAAKRRWAWLFFWRKSLTN
jgi:protein-tyrosine phosphatase